MPEAAIRFRFTDAASAMLAFDTLEELGYTPEYDGDSHTELHVHVEKRDLTSALEIAEAHGGQLVEEADLTEVSLMNQAYGMDLIPIPAHVVNEDWADDDRYAVRNRAPNHDDLSLRDEEAFGWIDDETTNQFPGGIHI
ncbi:DNA/RNA helicase [Paenibacillus apiarius]|uniref:DNA/RNA helicase n=1 Tax=Paenibacillus apiarius TaxID=46240 RepID=A0ABT4DRA6_9BACL|nr:DNA/RNA helicase [Paenibacillus apiarius]MCY9515642.1 DNA/RNA helicase [Paenibacillus apiarius]MCY9519285.1 DNA/RNA helicase [Paenibacillus apiarius]MCY9550921.1 DNA/RNA helicase [Paenibacillus apiarius]MCY9558987.1 DNA/RNA helicase [Paenibacillus apiarius]MCY9683536.1 DNA/RNA helicase [Paenibacillus apiarius]